MILPDPPYQFDPLAEIVFTVGLPDDVQKVVLGFDPDVSLSNV